MNDFLISFLLSCFQWDFWFSLGHHNIKLLLSEGMRKDAVLALVVNTVFVLHFFNLMQKI